MVVRTLFQKKRMLHITNGMGSVKEKLLKHEFEVREYLFFPLPQLERGKCMEIIFGIII